ncbi:SWIB-domain-containing protein [Fomitopsis betulina]|nr:SWIB-domain-containing protein [Fomitopsis betulina]
MADVESYEPLIRQILTAPGVDLSTISAKRVRKQLVEMDDSLTTEFVRENKDEFDRVIGGVYEEVSAAREDNGAKGKRTSRDEGDDYGSGGDGEEQEEQEGELKPAKAKRAKRAKKGSSTDEDLARQLDSEINGRQRAARASSTSTRGRGGKRRGRGGARSSNADELDEDGGPKKKRRGGGFQKEYMISEPLMAVIEVDKLSRPQTVKKLWEYIRRHNLQNPSNKKEILCDDKFKAVFDVDKIDMFAMNKQLGRHLREPEPQA